MSRAFGHGGTRFDPASSGGSDLPTDGVASQPLVSTGGSGSQWSSEITGTIVTGVAPDATTASRVSLDEDQRLYSIYLYGGTVRVDASSVVISGASSNKGYGGHLYLTAGSVTADDDANVGNAGQAFLKGGDVVGTDDDFGATIEAEGAFDGRGGGVFLFPGRSRAGGTDGAVWVRAANTTTTLIEAGSVGLGFFGHAQSAQPTSVAVTTAGIHAALVSLGLITGP